jgi:hypothetical protein
MLGRHLQHQQKKIEEDYKEINTHIEDIDAIKARIQTLQTEYDYLLLLVAYMTQSSGIRQTLWPGL